MAAITKDYQPVTGRSENQDRLTHTCLDSLGRQIGTRGPCLYHGPSSGEGGNATLGPFTGSPNCPLEKKTQDLKVENCVSFRALLRGFPGGSDGKESPCKAGDQGLIPGWGRSPGEGKGYPLQYSCLENSMHRGAWQAIVHRVAMSQTRLSD